MVTTDQRPCRACGTDEDTCYDLPGVFQACCGDCDHPDPQTDT